MCRKKEVRNILSCSNNYTQFFKDKMGKVEGGGEER